MPEITREEVRAWLESTARLSSTDRRMARAALAALEDAERVEWLDTATHQDDVALWVRSNQWHVVLTGDAYDRGFDGTSLRAAIDRARGVTPPADPPAPARA